MSAIDCYFFVDQEVPEKDQKMLVMHVECRNTHKPNQGWFYQGSVEGYGPFDFRCCICNELVHKAELNGQEYDEEEDV